MIFKNRLSLRCKINIHWFLDSMIPILSKLLILQMNLKRVRLSIMYLIILLYSLLYELLIIILFLFLFFLQENVRLLLFTSKLYRIFQILYVSSIFQWVNSNTLIFGRKFLFQKELHQQENFSKIIINLYW
jgi:hypothetical protein